MSSFVDEVPLVFPLRGRKLRLADRSSGKTSTITRNVKGG
jgi:hypothetical protein